MDSKVENHCPTGTVKPFLVCSSQNKRIKILWLLEHVADVKYLDERAFFMGGF